jgi:hypothetical protein
MCTLREKKSLFVDRFFTEKSANGAADNHGRKAEHYFASCDRAIERRRKEIKSR